MSRRWVRIRLPTSMSSSVRWPCCKSELMSLLVELRLAVCSIAQLAGHYSLKRLSLL